MALPERPSLSPVQRSRRELTYAAQLARELEAISQDELNALAIHLRLDPDILGYRKPSRMTHHLSHIGELISTREIHMQKHKFITKQLANTGLLAAAVGNNKQPPQDRLALLRAPLVERYAAKNPNVDHHVFVDVFMANDLHWLSEPVIPKTNARL